MNVLIEYVVGVRVGSIRRVERRNRGIDEDMNEGIVLFSSVIGNREAETLIDGSERRAGTRARGVALRGVIISLVERSVLNPLRVCKFCARYLPGSHNVERRQ